MRFLARTIGSHPMRRPPPVPSPFLMSTGRLAQRATTGYPFSVPNDESRVLSAYRTIKKGDTVFGRSFCDSKYHIMNECQ